MSNKRFNENNSSLNGIKIDSNGGYRIITIDSKSSAEDIDSYIIAQATMDLADEFMYKICSGNSIDDLTSFTIKAVKENYNNGNKLPEIVYNNIKRVILSIWSASKNVPDKKLAEMIIEMWTGFPISFKRISTVNFNRYFVTVGSNVRLNK